MTINNEANLERMMRAETVLGDYVREWLKSGTRQLCEDDAVDLITDLCHLLHSDEKLAGCVPPGKVKQLLERAYTNFFCEAVEPDDIELATRAGEVTSPDAERDAEAKRLYDEYFEAEERAQRIPLAFHAWRLKTGQ